MRTISTTPRGNIIATAVFLLLLLLQGCHKEEVPTGTDPDVPTAKEVGHDFPTRFEFMPYGEIPGRVSAMVTEEGGTAHGRSPGDAGKILYDHALVFHEEGSDITTYTFAVERGDTRSTITENILVLEGGRHVAQGL